MQIDPNRSGNFLYRPSPAASPKDEDVRRAADGLGRSHHQFQIYRKSWVFGSVGWRDVKSTDAVSELGKSEPAPVRVSDRGQGFLPVASQEDIVELEAFARKRPGELPSPMLAAALQALEHADALTCKRDGQECPANAYVAYNILTQDPNHDATALTFTCKGKHLPLEDAETAQDLAFLLGGLGTGDDVSKLAANLAAARKYDLTFVHAVEDYIELKSNPKKRLVVKHNGLRVADLSASDLARLETEDIRRMRTDLDAASLLQKSHGRYCASYWNFAREKNLDPRQLLRALDGLGGERHNHLPLIQAMVERGDLESEGRRIRPYLALEKPTDRLMAYVNEPDSPRDKSFYQSLIESTQRPHVAIELTGSLAPEQRLAFQNARRTLRESMGDRGSVDLLLEVVRAGKLEEHGEVLASLVEASRGKPLENYRTMAEKVQPGCEEIYLEFLRQGLPARRAAECSLVPPEQRELFDQLPPAGKKLAPEAIQLGRLQQDAAVLHRLSGSDDYQTFREVVPEGREELYLAQREAGVTGKRASTVVRLLKPEEEGLYAECLESLKAAGKDATEAFELTGEAVVMGRLAEDSERLASAGTLDRYRAMAQSGNEEFFLSLEGVAPEAALKLTLHTTDEDLTRNALQTADALVVAEAAQAGRLEQDFHRLQVLGTGAPALQRYQTFLARQKTLPEGCQDAFITVAGAVDPQRVDVAWEAVASDQDQLAERLSYWQELAAQPAGEPHATRILAAIPPAADLDLTRGVVERLGENAPSALEKASQCPNQSLAIGLLAAGCSPEEAAEFSQQPLPGQELGSGEQGRMLASLGQVMPDARAALDAYHFLASQLDQPGELPQAAGFLITLQNLTGEEREARLAFNDLTGREVDPAHGELMLEVLGQLKTYAATRRVWDKMESVPPEEARQRYDQARDWVEQVPREHRGRLLEEQMGQPLSENNWRALARLIGTRDKPVAEPVFSQLVATTFNQGIPEEARRQGLEELNMLSQGGSLLELAWSVRPLLPESLPLAHLTDWGEALRLVSNQEMAETLARCPGAANPVDLARLSAGRQPEAFEAFYARLQAEGGEGAVGFLARQGRDAEQAWETLSRPVRGETLAERQEQFERLYAASGENLGATQKIWSTLTRELGHPDPLGEPFSVALELTPHVSSSRSLGGDLLSKVLRPLEGTTPEQRTAAAVALLAGGQGKTEMASRFWSEIQAAVPAPDFLSSVEALSPLGETLEAGLGVVLHPVGKTTLPERVEAFQAMEARPHARAAIWKDTQSVLGPEDNFPNLLLAVERLAKASGSLDTVRKLKPLQGESMTERMVAFSAIQSVYPGNGQRALTLWDKVGGNLRPADTVESMGQALAELSMCLKSKPNKFDSVLDRLNKMRSEYGPAHDRSLYLLVHTLVTVTLNRTHDLEQALEMLPDDLPAVHGVEERGTQVLVGSVMVRKREGSSSQESGG